MRLVQTNTTVNVRFYKIIKIMYGSALFDMISIQYRSPRAAVFKRFNTNLNFIHVHCAYTHGF